MRALAERVPLPGVAERLDQRPSRVAEREQRDAEPRGVRQLHHPAETLTVGGTRVVARFAGEQERLGVDELDLARGDRPRAELVLEAAHPHTVAGAVATGPQHKEVRDAPARVRRPFGLGKDDERLTVAVRCEPLETVEQPRVAVTRRRRLQRAEIRSAGALGQQLRGLALPLAGFELGQHVVAHVGRRVRGDQRLHHAAAGAQRASHADVGLVEQVVGREHRQRRVHPGAPGPVAQRLLRVQDRSPRLGERRRHDDPADVVAPPVVAFEARRVAVGLLGPPRHRAAHQLADARQVRLGERQLVGLQVVGHRGLQGRIGGVPVETHRALVILGAVALRLLRRGERQPVHRLHVVVAHPATRITKQLRRQVAQSMGHLRRKPLHGSGYPLIGRGQRHPYVLRSPRAVELAGRDEDAELRQPRDGVTARLAAGRPQVEPGLRVVDGQPGRLQRRQ